MKSTAEASLADILCTEAQKTILRSCARMVCAFASYNYLIVRNIPAFIRHVSANRAACFTQGSVDGIRPAVLPIHLVVDRLDDPPRRRRALHRVAPASFRRLLPRVAPVSHAAWLAISLSNGRARFCARTLQARQKHGARPEVARGRLQLIP